MSAKEIIERVEKCRRTGRGQWISLCPAHTDKSPSLSIGESDDGRTLVHCHGGCSALDVLTAIGLSWDALYPEDEKHYKSMMSHIHKKPTVDDYVVDLAEHSRKAGKSVTAADKRRYMEALKRGGKANGFVDRVVGEVLMGEVEQTLKELGA